MLATLDRFAVRVANTADADGIGAVYARSWQSSYRGILPDPYLDGLDARSRAQIQRRNLVDGADLHLVAYDTTFLDIVGFCDAGMNRRGGPWGGEIYTLYLLDHAKRHGVGRQMFDRARAWLEDNALRGLIIWVLEANHHARRFYEALGGRTGPRLQTRVGGAPVIEQSYLWD